MDTRTRKRGRRIPRILTGTLSCLLALVLVTQLVWADTRSTLDSLARGMGAAPGELLTSEKVVPGDSISDWIALVTGRTGGDGSAYLQGLEDYVTARYKDTGTLDSTRATEWHRIALTALSLGGDPTDFGPDHRNLIADGTYNYSQKDSLGFQGLNAWLYALLTLDSRCYAVPEDAKYTRDLILTNILAAQEPGGAFGLNPGFGSVDMTAMALQALAPYQNSTVTYTLPSGRRTDIPTAVDKALTWLDGQMPGGTAGNSCSDAQVMLALCDLGRDPGRLRDTLESYRTEDDLFRYLPEDDVFDVMATEQVLLAQAALERLDAGERRIFDFREEMGEEVRAQIDTLNDTISQLDAEALDAQCADLYQQYLAIPAAERSYVSAFARLRAALDRTDTELTLEDPAQAYELTAPAAPRRQTPPWVGLAAAAIVIIVIAAAALHARKKGKKNA